jgi:hypothetical protein
MGLTEVKCLVTLESRNPNEMLRAKVKAKEYDLGHDYDPPTQSDVVSLLTLVLLHTDIKMGTPTDIIGL